MADENGAGAGLANVRLVSIAAGEEAGPFLQRAFNRRLAQSPSEAIYDLSITARERANPLAVQIDASVTRYNYRIRGRYTLIHRRTGERITGRAEAIASFNVVASQYSTLFAENAAREKAADVFAEQIERDILLELADRIHAEKNPPPAIVDEG